MSAELREKVARALAIGMGEIGDDVWKFYLREADAAIALVLEEAAKALYSVARWDREIFDGLTQTADGSLVYIDGSLVYIDEAAAAIRALKEQA